MTFCFVAPASTLNSSEVSDTKPEALAKNTRLRFAGTWIEHAVPLLTQVPTTRLEDESTAVNVALTEDPLLASVARAETKAVAGCKVTRTPFWARLISTMSGPTRRRTPWP